MLNRKRRSLRSIVLLLTAAILMIALCSCGTSSSKAKLTKGSINTSEQNSGTDLNAIADVLVSAYATDFNTQEMLVAASRGYDMTSEDYKSLTEYKDNGVNLDAAKNVINKAAEKAKTAVNVSNLNEADVETLVKTFQTTVKMTSEGGVIDKILCAIGAFLNWMTNTLGFGYYIIGICIFAILIEIAMFPFAIKQQKNSIRQCSLRPKEMAIKAKYKGRNDQVTMKKMQAEIQDLYSRENYSPYSGCLPLLVQLPIIMALYYIVIDPLHYVLGQASALSTNLTAYLTASPAAGGLGQTVSNSSRGSIALLNLIRERGVSAFEGLADFRFFTNGQDLFKAVTEISGKIPKFNIGSVNFGETPSFQNPILLLVPVLTFVTYFFTMRLTRKFTYQPAVNEGVDAKQAACSNTMMDVTMPAMSTWFTFLMPSLIGVYWIFRSVLGFGKTVLMAKIMPLPEFTEEDYKAAAREMAGKKVVVKSENAGMKRSLHHIDDEDFDDTREAALQRKAAMEELERQKAEEGNNAPTSLFGFGKLKKDRKNDGKKPTDDNK